MRRDPAQSDVIQAEQVRIVNEPVLMGGQLGPAGGITVVPVLDGDLVRALEIRCACGQHMAIECLYGPPTGQAAPQDQRDDSASPREE
ncbi:MAG: hypothetical protein ACE5F1_12740 [Planctomycetota bacterium]